AAAAVEATAMMGSHHGIPSGPTSENENKAARPTSTAIIGTSAASNAGTGGDSFGATVRRQARRVARPTDPFKTLPRYPRPAARNNTRRETVPPAAATHTCHASLRASSARSEEH